MRFKYCPDCGKLLINKIAGDDGEVPYCEKCQKYWFDSFSDCVIILVANELDEIALCRQGYLSDKYSTFVSGYITPGETAEEAAFREVKEEIGIDIDNLFYAGTYWFDLKDQLMHGFIGITKKKDLVISSELDDANWIEYQNALDYMFPPGKGNCTHIIYSQYKKMIEKTIFK